MIKQIDYIEEALIFYLAIIPKLNWFLQFFKISWLNIMIKIEYNK